MKCRQLDKKTRAASCDGFSLVELLATIAVIMIMAAGAIPLMQSTMGQMRLRSAVAAVTGSVQAARYQAISNGYQFQLAYDQTKRTYQASSDPNAVGTFTNVGGAVPFAASTVSLTSSTTLQFSPSGKVSATVGALPIVLKMGGKTATITVSPYGNTSVTYAP
jgi:prepilin-type N-terminal cleavage/methylation domain-containing protein